MQNNQMPAVDVPKTPSALARYTSKTFLWMFIGLLLTFGTSLAVLRSEMALRWIYGSPAVPFIILIAELVIVLFLSARIQKLSTAAATALFFAYSIVNGLTFSSVFLLYDLGSVVFAFGWTALFFGTMALYGFATKKDLTRIGYILSFGVIFLLLFWVASLFLNLSMFQTAICFIGIVIFLGLTAYDTQKIKNYHALFAADPDMLAKASIFAALQLYLDFINIFLYILRLLGNKRS